MRPSPRNPAPGGRRPLGRRADTTQRSETRRLLEAGKTNKEIAASRGVTERGASAMVGAILHAAGVESRAEYFALLLARERRK